MENTYNYSRSHFWALPIINTELLTAARKNMKIKTFKGGESKMVRKRKGKDKEKIPHEQSPHPRPLLSLILFISDSFICRNVNQRVNFWCKETLIGISHFSSAPRAIVAKAENHFPQTF